MNDDRPIEKLLRRYATKRRDAAADPLGLHPATRRLLQGEVSRQFPQAGAADNRAVAGWFAVFRRRWMYAAAALGMLLIAGVMLVMNSEKPQLATESPSFELAKNEMSPAKAAGGEVFPQKEGAGAVVKVTAPVPVSAPARETSPSPRTVAASTSLGNDKQPRASAQALAFNVDADRQRALNEMPAPTPSGSLSRDAGQFALAQNEIAKKAPPVTPLETYASAATTNQSASGIPAAKPLSLATAATFADERSSLGIAAQDRAADLADSGVRLDSKVTANPTENLPLPAAAPVAFETQTGVAAAARYGLSTRAERVAVSQSFANRAPTPVMKTLPKDSPTSAVLANFQMEQAGDQLRVIDGDGSIYLGDLEPAPGSYGGFSQDTVGFKQEEKLAVRRLAIPAAASQSAAQKYFYRVAGTNRTLNQRVEFTWNFVAQTNAQAQSKTKSVSETLKQDSSGVPPQFPTLLQNSAIKGRAQINAVKEIEINAVPVRP